MVWAGFLIKTPTDALYFTEKLWMICWIIFQFLTFVIAYIAAQIAVSKPQILLNVRWNQTVS